MKMRNKSGTLVQRRYPRKYARYPREKIQVPSTPTKHKHEAPSSKNIFSRRYCATMKCPTESRFTLDVPNAPMYLPRSDISCISLYRLNESPFSSRVDVRDRRHFDEGSCRYPRTLYHYEVSTSESGHACALAHPRRFFTPLTFPTCPGGLCTAGITDEIFVTWYSTTTLSSIHTAPARTEPWLLTASDVRHLGWANERVSPSSFAPVIGAGQPLQHGEVRDTNLAWVRPVCGAMWDVELFSRLRFMHVLHIFQRHKSDEN